MRQDVTGFFMMLQRDRVRGGVGIQAPARGGDSGPGARGGVGIRARRGVGIIWGKMGNFLPFCRFFAVWVEICISSRLCMILYFQKLIVLYSND